MNARKGQSVDVADVAGGGVAKDAQFVSNAQFTSQRLDGRVREGV